MVMQIAELQNSGMGWCVILLTLPLALAFLCYYTGAGVPSIEFSLLFILLTLMLSIASYYGVERASESSAPTRNKPWAGCFWLGVY